MLESLSPYLEYKDSNQPIFGQIPKHWKVVRNGRIFSQRNQTGFPDLPILEVSLKTGVRVRDFENSNRKQVMSDREKYKRAIKGDIAYNMMRMWQGALGVAPVDGLVSPAYVVASPLSEVDSRYFSYLFRTQTYMNEVNKYSHGIVADRNRLYWDEFKQIPSLFPPFEEQHQIVKYLDFQLAKINRLIFAKRRQIALLKEKVDTMTNRAITIDSINTPRLVNVSNQIGDWIRRKDDQEYIPIGLLNRGRGIFHKPPILGSDLGDSEFYQVEDNALIFSGQFAWEGAVALTEEKDKKCISSHRYYMIRGIEGVAKNEYLWALFRTKYGELLLNLNSRGAAGRNRPLNMGSLLKEHIPLPPMAIQEEISKEVNILLHFVKAVNRLEDLLIEYRTRLISDVVTGRVDVRDLEINEIIEDDTFYLEEELDDNDEVVDIEECEV